MIYASTHPAAGGSIRESRNRHLRRRHVLLAVMALAILAGFCCSLTFGQTYVPFSDVIRILAGETVPGAGFTVGQLRLPRAVLGLVAGMSFGLGGAAFQTLLRNPLASPDIIGITSGASAAAVFSIVILGIGGPAASVFAVVAGLAVALLVHGRVPVLVVEDDRVGAREVDAETAGARRQDEAQDARVVVEAVHKVLTLLDVR